MLKRYADAAAPLYQSLDDGQKQRFEVLSRVGRPDLRPLRRLAISGEIATIFAAVTVSADSEVSSAASIAGICPGRVIFAELK